MAHFAEIMPFKLFHGDSVDDTGPWCPVCFDLNFQNLAKCPKQEGKARPGWERKGALHGFNLWWRARPDFQQRAEKYKCVFCAVLLQIVDRFWKRQARSQAPRRIEQDVVYSLRVFENDSVEIMSMVDDPRRPLGLLLYTPSGHSPAWGRLPPAPEISSCANSKRALQYLRDQLERCCQEHEECNYAGSVLPTRVLDIGRLATQQHLKLFEPPRGTQGKYIALSYCWGDGNGLQATKSNLSELLQGIDHDELPATIQDAVELARYLEVQYLWVDALCILQDDTQDWLHESARMSTVYAQAFLTVSASSVSSSRTSFLHQSRGNKEVLFQLPESATTVQDTQLSADTSSVPGGLLAVRRTTLSGFHQDDIDDIIDPAMTRAWTLQEHTLSTRLVCFSTDEIQWTCRTLRACECENPEQSESPRLEELRRDLRMAGTKENTGPDESVGQIKKGWAVDFYHFWTELIEAYCRRDLSCTRDKLPALSGLAHRFSETFDEARLVAGTDAPPLRYLAGLWDFEIHTMLLWSSQDARGYGCFEEYRAPSWSWASVEGRIQNHADHQSLQRQAEVLDAVCTLANPYDLFGQVVRAGTYLRLRATVLEARMWLSRRGPGWGIEHMTKYGPVHIDGGLEEVPVDSVVWGVSSAATAAALAVADGSAETSGPVQTRTLQRLLRKPRSSHGAEWKTKMRDLPGFESQSGSDDESDNTFYGRHEWEEANLGRDFTVWLLHIACDNLDPNDPQEQHLLVLGRPAGDEQVYERIGYLGVRHKDKWAEDVAGKEKSVITVV